MAVEQQIICGKRKTAVAKLRFKEGSGKVFYNGLLHTELNLFHKLALSEPVRIYEQVLGELKHDMHITTSGGGREGQIQAARLAIAKALIRLSGSDVLKKYYISYDR